MADERVKVTETTKEYELSAENLWPAAADD